MKNLLALVFLITIAGCGYDEKIHIADVRPIISAQFQANMQGIMRVEQQLKDEHIDSIAYNVELMKELWKTHADMLTLLQDLDNTDDKEAALTLTKDFIANRFDNLHPFVKVDDMKLTKDSPISMLKLFLVNKESFYINARSMGYSYKETDRVSFSKFEPFVIADKPVFKKGEKITGRIFLAVVPDWKDSGTRKAMNQVKVNGQAVVPTAQGCRFEISGNTINGEYKLEATIGMPDTTFTAGSSVYVRGN